MTDPSSDSLPASSDGQFFLPGAESESQYAIFAGKAPNGNAIHEIAQQSSTTGERQTSSNEPTTPTPLYVNVPPKKDDVVRKESLSYDSVLFISDVVKATTPTEEPSSSSVDYETVVTSPSSSADVRGKKSSVVYNDIRGVIATSSPIATDGEPPTEVRFNPFLSPVQPFTAPDMTTPPQKPAAPPARRYTELKKADVEPENVYEPVTPRGETAGDEYEPVEVKSKNDDYEVVEVRQKGVPVVEELDDGMEFLSESDSFASDELIEEWRADDEGNDVRQPALVLTEAEKERHLLLPRFSVVQEREGKLERRRSNLPENPYLSQALMEKVTMSIRGKRCAILPPMPTGLDRDATKRYLILDTIMSTERSYVDSLRRLVDMYATPLAGEGGGHGATLSAEKVEKIFHKVREIWMHHNMFLIALSGRVAQWHAMIKIGDIFEGSFNKKMVADDYTDFINNFEIAMETLNAESSQSHSFRKFLEDCRAVSSDKLDIKSLLLKPVQRFPQFILCLQDMLRYCGVGHPDRVSLQLALTRLEFLTDTLNERKRAIEARSYVRELDKRMTHLEQPLQQNERRFVRLDFVEQQITKKGRIVGRRCCLFMLNDVLVCATLLKVKDKRAAYHGKFKFKWMVPLSDVKVVDVDYVLQQRLIERQNLKREKSKRQKSPSFLDADEGLDARSSRLRQKRDDYLSDFALVSQISGLVAMLKDKYKVLDVEKTRRWCQRLQERIVSIDEKIREQEGGRLDMLLPSHREPGTEAVYTFIMESAKNKEAWLIGLQTTRLKQRKQNNPGWLMPGEDDPDSGLGSADFFSPSMPLFDVGLQVCPTLRESSVCCGACFDEGASPARTLVWVCCEREGKGIVSILSEESLSLNVVETFQATTSTPLCSIFVMLKRRYDDDRPTVWIGTRGGTIYIFGCQMNRPAVERKPLLQIQCSASVRDMKVCGNRVFVALGDGQVSIYNIQAVSKKVNDFRHSTVLDSLWSSESLVTLMLSDGKTSVNSLSPAKNKVWCASGNSVTAIDADSLKIETSFKIDSGESDVVSKIVHVGVGVWLGLHGSSSIHLYHTETRELLQTVSVGNLVRRLPKDSAPRVPSRHRSTRFKTGASTLSITSLLAARGRLWVGLSDGHVVTLPVARLGGVPLTTDRGSVSAHRFRGGPVRFLLCTALSPPSRGGGGGGSGGGGGGEEKKQPEKSFIKENNEDAEYDDDSPAYVSFPGKGEDDETETENRPLPPIPTNVGDDSSLLSLPPPPTPAEVSRSGETSVGERSWPSPPPPPPPSAEVDKDYDIPWDLVKKAAAAAAEAAVAESEASAAAELADSSVVDDVSNSVFYDDQHLKDDVAEKTLDQVRGEKVAYRMILAGGEGYCAGESEADDAGVLVWRIDY